MTIGGQFYFTIYNFIYIDKILCIKTKRSMRNDFTIAQTRNCIR